MRLFGQLQICSASSSDCEGVVFHYDFGAIARLQKVWEREWWGEAKVKCYKSHCSYQIWPFFLNKCSLDCCKQLVNIQSSIKVDFDNFLPVLSLFLWSSGFSEILTLRSRSASPLILSEPFLYPLPIKITHVFCFLPNDQSYPLKRFVTSQDFSTQNFSLASHLTQSNTPNTLLGLHDTAISVLSTAMAFFFTIGPLTYSTIVTLASFLLLEHARHTPASQFFSINIPFAGVISLQITIRFIFLHPKGLFSNTTFQREFPWLQFCCLPNLSRICTVILKILFCILLYH